MTHPRFIKTLFVPIVLSSLCFSLAGFSLAVAAETVAPDTTPQPPLIEQAQKTNHEPQPEETSTSDSKTDNNTVNRTIGNTPQPPLVDQPEPSSYEPATTDKITNDKKTDAEQVVEKTAESQTSWADTRQQGVSADWLQLTSGEWLRGRIIVMQKEMLEFDSDELNNLEIKWKKVKYIKSSEPYSLRFDGRQQATGAIEITQDEVHVTTDYDDQTFKRSKLLSIASGHETEISKWVNKVTFSVNARRGNTNQTDFSSKISAKRRTINSRLLLDYLGNFTEVEKTETINNHRLSATYDIFLTRDLFLTPISAEFFRDPFQNIKQRINVGIAIGYTLLNNNKTEWDISGGPAYQETDSVSVQAGQSTKDITATVKQVVTHTTPSSPSKQS